MSNWADVHARQVRFHSISLTVTKPFQRCCSSNPKNYYAGSQGQISRETASAQSERLFYQIPLSMTFEAYRHTDDNVYLRMIRAALSDSCGECDETEPAEHFVFGYKNLISLDNLSMFSMSIASFTRSFVPPTIIISSSWLPLSKLWKLHFKTVSSRDFQLLLLISQDL